MINNHCLALLVTKAKSKAKKHIPALGNLWCDSQGILQVPEFQSVGHNFLSNIGQKFDLLLIFAIVVKNQWKSYINAKQVYSYWIINRQYTCKCFCSPFFTALAKNFKMGGAEAWRLFAAIAFWNRSAGNWWNSCFLGFLSDTELSLKADYKFTRGFPAFNQGNV